MASLRIKVRNLKDLDKMLPKLKRSLSVQYNVEFQEEGQGQGIFLLMVKQDIQLNQLVSIKNMLDAYNFEFAFQTVDADGNDVDSNENDDNEDEQASPSPPVVKSPRQTKKPKRQRVKKPLAKIDLAKIEPHWISVDKIVAPVPRNLQHEFDPRGAPPLGCSQAQFDAFVGQLGPARRVGVMDVEPKKEYPGTAKELMEAIAAMKKLKNSIRKKDAAEELTEAVTAMKKLLEPIANKGVK